ncbi:phosphatase PAP2 family protein [Hydrogenophaga bisanensis]|jgi:undecaprenyl-diphosphatase|uniref:Phosphatase PAP2 family protein n=1 Tax=Hydrogenophaga bisanensis TaxID=439611 RepID=A0ABW2REY8_9BURK
MMSRLALRGVHRHRWEWPPFAVAVVAAGLFFWLAHEAAIEHEHSALELDWMRAISALRTDVMTSALLWVNRVHDEAIASLIFIILAAQAFRRRWRQFHLLLAMGPGAMLLNLLAKSAFQRPRPPVDALVSAHGYAFPSGHTIAAAATAAMLIYLTWHQTTSPGWRAAVAIVAVSMALVVGFSRVYLGAHYPSDVMASLLEAVAWSCLCIEVGRYRPDLSGEN